MSDPSVSERRIRPIQDAIASKNWKQALKECDKWQKKGEKSDKFLALKAFVLVNQPDHNQTRKGQTETLQLCHRDPAVTDIEAIHFLQDALKDLSLQNEEAPKLWDRAAAARPTDQDLLMIWLNDSIADSNWRSAQKAAMALRKAFPKDRQYEFWNILMYFLVFKDVSVPEKDRNLFGSLAYRLISKSAAIIPTAPEQLLSPGKAISTPEELYLLVQIYLDTGHASEAVDLFQSPTLSEESRLGQQDPQLHTTLLLKALEGSQRWGDAFAACKKLVQKPEYRGDDRVWDLLFKASSDPQLKDEYKSLIDDYTTKRQLRDRPALLTKLKNLRTPNAGDPVPFADILIVCTQYYRLYKDKSFCFEDLKQSLESLDGSHRKDFEEFLDGEVDQKPTASNRLFQLKLERLTEPSHEDDQEAKVLSRASSGIALLHSSLSDHPACPEAGLLAAMDLLLLSKINEGKRMEYLLRAILLLELCRSKDDDYYPYAILLIQCYINIGLMSLAMEVYVKLSIKNLQWENVAHLILSRISSLHPDQHGKGENALNPFGALNTALEVLDRSNEALNRGISQGLRAGSYSNIIDSVQLKRDLEKSLNRQVYALEERKIRRLRGDPDADDGMFVVRAEETVDKRDFSFFPAYCKADEEIYDMLRPGPLLGEAWIDAMALVQYLMRFLKHDDSSPEWMDKLNQFVARAGPPDRIKEVLTVSEWRVYEVAFLVQGIVKGVQRGDDEEAVELLERIKHNLQVLVEQSEAKLADDGGSMKILGWRYLHQSYVTFEMGCVVQAFVGWCERRSKGKGKKSGGGGGGGGAGLGGLKTEDLQSLKKVLGELGESIKENARQVKRGLSEGGVLGRLVDIVMAREEEGEGWKEYREEMGKVLGGDGEAAVEVRMGRWLESWEDALDGVLGVKVKLGK